jgi:glycine cleavage system aminomethyltransferase T
LIWRHRSWKCALFDTNWHAVFSLTGRDRVKYLHAISSNNIQALATGQGTLALLLNPQGRIQAELEVYVLPEKLLVLSHASLREQTLALLRKYVIGSQVKIEDLTELVGSFAVEGPRATVIIEQACGVKIGELPEMSILDVTVEGIPCQLVRRSHFGEVGAEFIAGRDCLGSLWEKLLAGVRAHGGEAIGMSALDTLRLEAGLPWFPADSRTRTSVFKRAVTRGRKSSSAYGRVGTSTASVWGSGFQPLLRPRPVRSCAQEMRKSDL